MSYILGRYLATLPLKGIGDFCPTLSPHEKFIFLLGLPVTPERLRRLPQLRPRSRLAMRASHVLLHVHAAVRASGRRRLAQLLGRHPGREAGERGAGAESGASLLAKGLKSGGSVF